MDQDDARPNNYFKNIEKDHRYENSTATIFDRTRENWKPYGNYKAGTVEEIAKKGKRL